MANSPDRGVRGLPGGKPKYSAFSLARNAGSYHQNWQRAWRAAEPKAEYDAVIVGGGGHGLATAYYLAAVHGMTNIAVVEKGWLGGGNTGRNTTIIRSNYMWDESAAIYDHALKLWEGLSQDINFNVMFSQRGVLTIAHSEHELREMSRRVHAIRLNGIDSEVLGPDEIKKFVPIINIDQTIRYPVMGGFLQKRGGTARHDAVAWGYARAADDLGVDIIQNCEVTGLRRKGDRIEGIETTRGFIKTPKVGVSLPAIVLFLPPWRGSGCRSPAVRCRRLSLSRSSQCLIPSSCQTPCICISASPTRARWFSVPVWTNIIHTPSAVLSPYLNT